MFLVSRSPGPTHFPHAPVSYFHARYPSRIPHQTKVLSLSIRVSHQFLLRPATGQDETALVSGTDETYTLHAEGIRARVVRQSHSWWCLHAPPRPRSSSTSSDVGVSHGEVRASLGIGSPSPDHRRTAHSDHGHNAEIVCSSNGNGNADGFDDELLPHRGVHGKYTMLEIAVTIFCARKETEKHEYLLVRQVVGPYRG